MSKKSTGDRASEACGWGLGGSAGAGTLGLADRVYDYYENKLDPAEDAVECASSMSEAPHAEITGPNEDCDQEELVDILEEYREARQTEQVEAEPITNRFVVIDGEVVVGDGLGSVQELQLATGARLDSVETGGIDPLGGLVLPAMLVGGVAIGFGRFVFGKG